MYTVKLVDMKGELIEEIKLNLNINAGLHTGDRIAYYSEKFGKTITIKITKRIFEIDTECNKHYPEVTDIILEAIQYP